VKVTDTKTFEKEVGYKVVYRKHSDATETMELDLDTFKDLGIVFEVSGMRRLGTLEVKILGSSFKWQS
jgi:hypothetical protein